MVRLFPAVGELYDMSEEQGQVFVDWGEFVCHDNEPITCEL